MSLNILKKKLIVILVEPEGTINIGSVARLCANFNVDELRLVAPSCDHKDLNARRMALKGIHFLEGAKIFNSLLDALVDCERIIATCGRIDHDTKAIPLESTENGLKWLISSSNEKPIAIVFGRESRGLTNTELHLAHKVITLKSSVNYPSINLSHAVGIVLNELNNYRINTSKQKLLSIESSSPSNPKDLNDLIIDSQELLIEIGFLLNHTANARMLKVRTLLNRFGVTAKEIAMLRGMIRQIRWAINSEKS